MVWLGVWLGVCEALWLDDVVCVGEPVEVASWLDVCDEDCDAVRETDALWLRVCDLLRV